MFEKTVTRRGKKRLLVRLVLVSGEEVESEVFVGPEERLADLLNDERAFLPIGVGEAVEVIAKGQIARAAVVASVPTERADPYDVLRIERTASDEEVRRAWMEGLKASHPDRLAALDLAPEVIYAARKTCQRVNAAYEAITAARRAAA